jgi:helicase
MPGIMWLKVTDPAAKLPLVSPDTDLRVLVPDAEEFATRGAEFRAAGARVRQVKYLLEDEVITASRGQQAVTSWACALNRPYRATFTKATGHAARAARDAFDLMWQDAEPIATPRSAKPTESATPADILIPVEVAPFLPYPSLNQAQAEVVPEILDHDQNLLVVAPTGAGKTVMGMVAALRVIQQQGRKAAWLVPQRSLADELDRELESWRARGLRVERLSGEYATDIARI